ncbi:MAG: calcium/sodium antiporter [Bacteroidales bacterium]|nr:calcium/sodium antiporter [Bacteroidales bacterium]
MLYDIFKIIIGLILLIKGGDYLIEGSVTIARKFKLSKMVIGLTIIGFGTSMPELLVSAQAALSGNPGIAIGNVVGSNISNIALILGTSAMICVLPTSRSTMRIDLPFMTLASIIFVGIAMSGSIERVPGIMLFALLIAFVAWQIRRSRKQEEASAVEETKDRPMWVAWAMVIGSFMALVWGADLLVDGASSIAKRWGVSDRMIGLTIVSVGTSLPELFASIMAARKGETDMAVGNIIGSVTFNLLCVVGLAAAICPITDSGSGFEFDYLLMIGIGLLLWFFMCTKRRLERWEGIVLFIIYLVYIGITIYRG